MVEVRQKPAFGRHGLVDIVPANSVGGNEKQLCAPCLGPTGDQQWHSIYVRYIRARQTTYNNITFI